MKRAFRLWAVFFAVVFIGGYTIAAPAFLRARKRSCAAKIVNDARIYEAAIDQWAIENTKKATPEPPPASVKEALNAAAEAGHFPAGQNAVPPTETSTPRS